MKVVFLEEVEGSGRIGEVRNVADGYARNYLLPRKLAVPATDHNIRMAQARAGGEVKRQAGLDAEAAVLAEKLVGLTITIEVRVGEQGRLYGSVTSRDICEALEKPLGMLLEHRQVELEEPIRQVGLFEVPIRLSRNVRASAQVAVLGEGQTLEKLQAPPPEEAEEEQPAEAVEEQPAEAIEEQPAEAIEEQPAEAIEEQPAEAIEEQPAEAIEEQPAEAGKEEPPQEAEAKQEKKGRKRRPKGEGEQS